MLTHIDSQIIASMARTFWVDAYASAWDNDELKEDAPHAGAGDDWFDYAPPTPEEAVEFAAYVAGQVSIINKNAPFLLVREAAKADGEHPDDIEELFSANGKTSYIEEFGYCLAMQCLGSGVRWTDNHEDFGLQTPLVEFYPDFGKYAKDA